MGHKPFSHHQNNHLQLSKVLEFGLHVTRDDLPLYKMLFSSLGFPIEKAAYT